ncbi:hypothetical protein [Asanoa sp. NPDC050611]|uniref:hypothetical protein n=1 Tax=Asanoa sp. NPDC050611 TaxID=3157098 RepID=UPI0033F244E4
MARAFPGRRAGSLCALWRALTDRVRLKPDETEQAEAVMTRAAREWLALDQSDSRAIHDDPDYLLHGVSG